MGYFYQAKVKKAKAEVRVEVTGCQEETTDGRKHCLGSWQVRVQVGFVSPESAGAARCLPPPMTSSQSARLVGPGFPKTDSSCLSHLFEKR